MTHDELMVKIAEPAHNLNANDARNVYLVALRAVVELITKEDTIPLDDYHFGYMAACKDIYEAIEKELK